MREPEATSSGPRTSGRGERGALLVTVLVVMIPLLILVAGAITLMTGRNSALLRSLQETKALCAAEAGIQETLQRANTGTLDPSAPIERDLGGGMSTAVSVVQLSTDGADNDGDGLVDEADERAFEVLAYGYHAQATKRLSAVLVEPAALPPFHAAILALGTPDIVTKGGALVSGFDTNINGTRGLPANDVAGIATEPPHDTAGLESRYTQSGSSLVQGSPAFDTTASPYDLPGLIASVQNSTQNQLVPGSYTGSLGSAAANTWQVSYCPGNLHLSGGGTGAGILVVLGDLDVSGSLRWDGLVVVLGNFTTSGGVLVNGAVIQGPAGQDITLVGGSSVRFSSEALGHLPGLLRPAFGVTGWREVSRW